MNNSLYAYDIPENKPKKRIVKKKKTIYNTKKTTTKRTKDEITLVLTIKRDSKNEAEKNLYKALDLLSEDNEMLYYVKLALYNYYPDFMSLNNLSDIEKKPKKIRKKKSPEQPKQDSVEIEEPIEDENDDIFSSASISTSSD